MADNRAASGGTLELRRCAVTRPTDTVVVIVTDLFDGGDPDRTVDEAARLTAAGVTVAVIVGMLGLVVAQVL